MAAAKLNDPPAPGQSIQGNVVIFLIFHTVTHSAFHHAERPNHTGCARAASGGIIQAIHGGNLRGGVPSLCLTHAALADMLR